ncbi:MAG TPA: helix-turn-helix domain-containing protein [Clostridia bacterium]
MYESITYAELKSLPRDQKIEALKELMATCSSQKKIAEKLGVNPPNIYSMISRYIKEDTDKKPRKKKNRMKSKEEAVNKVTGDQAARDEQIVCADTANGLFEANPAENVQAMETAAVQPAREEDASDTQSEWPGQNGFLVSIDKELTGEEMGPMLAAIGNVLLKNTGYRIFLKITEK